MKRKASESDNADVKFIRLRIELCQKITPAAAATGTWTEEEIRHQPRAWIRSLTNIDALRSALNNFLEPLLRKENLQIILTGAGTSAFIGDIIAPWLASHTGKTSAPYQPPIWSPIQWTT